MDLLGFGGRWGGCFIFTFFNEHMKHIGGKWLGDGKEMGDGFHQNVLHTYMD